MENEKNATNGEEKQLNNSPAACNAEHQDVEEKNESKASSVLLEKGQIEERFKIDRRKLEKMILGLDYVMITFLKLYVFFLCNVCTHIHDNTQMICYDNVTSHTHAN